MAYNSMEAREAVALPRELASVGLIGLTLLLRKIVELAPAIATAGRIGDRL
jgi:hypothetical protein